MKRGLRDLNGKGVLAGLTNISDIISSKTVDGKSVPCEGKLYYRGYDVEELVRRQAGDHFGFERIAYLLLFGDLPSQEQTRTFCELLSFYRTLPTSFVRDIIMKAPSSDMMNTLARSVLTLYSYDEDAEDISIPNVLRQSMPVSYTHLMAGISKLHTEAATITPAANPKKIRWAPAVTRFRKKNTMADPRAVMKKVNPVPAAAHATACISSPPRLVRTSLAERIIHG